MSGRAPSTNVALPINTCCKPPHCPGVVVSPRTGSRQIAMLVTSTSSIAQPVTPTDPETVLPSAGESIEPVGPVELVKPVTFTAMFCDVQSPFVDGAMLTKSVVVLPAGKKPLTVIVMVADPHPLVGETERRPNALGVAVQHGVAPGPEVVSRTVCGSV